MSCTEISMGQNIIRVSIILSIVMASTIFTPDGLKSGGIAGIFAILSPPAASAKTIVLGANDLGMHCMDREFSIFSILPPFNVVNAQVIMQDAGGHPFLADNTLAMLTYSAVADPSGSINSTSVNKTGFWNYAGLLFGATLQPGEGLTGQYMPKDNPQQPGPQPFQYQTSRGWFTAQGIPITPLDNQMKINTYSLLRITARDPSTSTSLGHLDVVVPVAAETDCKTCHKTGGIAAQRTNINWSNDVNIEIQSKTNILRLHDADWNINLEAQKPVLCAQCHYSRALDLSGKGVSGDQVGHQYLSRVMHKYHGNLKINGVPVFPPTAPVEQTCYQCHPGKKTQCLRDVMRTGGILCNNCHGDMLAVGGAYKLLPGGSINGQTDGKYRRPWLDLPRCQSCHTGDAVSHLTGNALVFNSSGIRLTQAFKTGDLSASPLLATNKRFAENTNNLFRYSKGHGNISCEGCHGSTHAVWPSRQRNDNLAAQYIQKHSGPIIECDACHAPGSLQLTVDGPHGLHNVNDSRWINDGRHSDFFERDPDNCRACHGIGLTGSVLAKAAMPRSFTVEDGGTVTIGKGQQVRCNLCHSLPN
jgi:hypothetical protein